MDVNFNASSKDRELIARCSVRAHREMGMPRIDTAMDLAVANNDIPLDLQRLLYSKRHDFVHDVGGIARFLNRQTGKLEGCFVPRCAKPEAVS